MPPVPREAYATLRALIRSDQVPAARVAELLTDATFRGWMEECNTQEEAPATDRFQPKEK